MKVKATFDGHAFVPDGPVTLARATRVELTIVSVGAEQTPHAHDPHHGTDATESLYEALNRFGLVGCLGNGPADLSTNRAYFDGFGENP